MENKSLICYSLLALSLFHVQFLFLSGSVPLDFVLKNCDFISLFLYKNSWVADRALEKPLLEVKKIDKLKKSEHELAK